MKIEFPSVGSTSKEQGFAMAAVGAAASIGMIIAVSQPSHSNPLVRTWKLFTQFQSHETKLTSSEKVDTSITEYNALHAKTSNANKLREYKSLVNAYYDLSTIFYEWGWSSCFHFTTPWKHEGSFMESCRRHEYYLASFLQTNMYEVNNNKNKNNTATTTSGPKRILDVGCGIGGPARNISMFLQCHITGVTLNSYQVARGNYLCALQGLANVVKLLVGDFMELTTLFKDEPKFDGAYAIEATCHAPDRVKCYNQVLQMLKPGAIFAVYEWCLTDKYDPNNPDHVEAKLQIETGNGLPDIATTKHCLEAMKDAGFEVIHARDLALDGEFLQDDPDMLDANATNTQQTWYSYMLPSYKNPFNQNFQLTNIGFAMINGLVGIFELLGVAPKGSVKTHRMLRTGAIGLGSAGKAGTFTAMYLMVGRVPVKKQ